MATDVVTGRQAAELIRVLRPHCPPIERVDIHGSRANGRARPDSDIDLVLAGPVDADLLATLAMELEESYLSVSVDLSAYATMEAGGYRDRVLATARPLFDGAELRSGG